MQTEGPVGDALANVLSDAASVRDGTVADYIPELAHADPEHFGISVVSVLGRVYSAGDNTVEFTIQSVSKPFVYALALSELGLETVARHVGFEPSGNAFNAISLDPDTGRPANSMINAGAIVTAALIDGADPAERFERVRRCMSRFAGRELAVDERVYASELATGDRNRALAYLTLSAGVLPRPVDEAVEVYFRQCSVLVTVEDIATMSATLANGGVNPRTGDEVVDETVARHTLSLMASCGMYDHAGEWMVRVGLPAKSGVSGGIAAVQPAEFGIGVFSPRLDEFGNSARGVAALTALSEDFGLHMLTHPSEPRPAVERTEVDADGRLVVALRGELEFLAAEQIVHHLGSDQVRGAVTEGGLRIDLSGVTRIRPAAERLLAVEIRELVRSGIEVIVDDPEGVITGAAAPDGTTLPAG